MLHRALNVMSRSLLAATCAIVSIGCARASSGNPESAEAARQADSTRVAQSDRRRSSASQVVDFTMEERVRFTRVEQMIQAHFSGVTVTNSGSGFSIRIRGTSSFASSNEPLIIIDGASRSAGELSSLNTRDVVRIEIIKDAAAFYGVRGANGVILITTRRSS